jgi:hypothetical protein
MSYGTSPAAHCEIGGGISRRSTLDNLKERKKEFEAKLEKVNQAIDLFEQHPEIAKALDLLGSI